MQATEGKYKGGGEEAAEYTDGESTGWPSWQEEDGTSMKEGALKAREAGGSPGAASRGE